MKTIVLAEKPSVGKEIARVLGCTQKGEGYIQNNNYIVTWALGHLVTLAVPEVYDDKWAKWDLETLPMIPDKFKTSVIPEVAKQYKIVKTLLQKNDVGKLVIATDAGREGELVARWIIEKARFTKPIFRLWISSLTDASIKKGFSNLLPASHYDNLYYSAESRAIADWLIGINVTRALTTKYNAQLSAGRVQTPTLAMIVNREEEIKKFVPVPFEKILLDYKNTEFTLNYTQSESRIFEHQTVEKLITDLKGNKGKITKVTRENKKELQPLLYDLTELQRDANRYYGFSAKQTLDIIQRLYEHHKYLTYPRTDSRYLTKDMFEMSKQIIKNFTTGEYSKFAAKILSTPITLSKRIFDDAKVTDHHAIIPTEIKPNLNILSDNELKIMELVIKRFLSVFMKEETFEKIKVELKIKNYTFTTSGKRIIDVGWKAVYQNLKIESDEENAILPDFKENENVDNYQLRVKKGMTEPPQRYTEATLLTAMEHPGKFIDDKEMKAIIEENSGIGTPATRADIIEKLFNVNYMELKGKSIYPTSKGIQLVKLVPEDLKSPLLTAKWEKRLNLIKEGKEKKEVFIRDIEKSALDLINNVKIAESKFKHDNMVSKKCPLCNANLLDVADKVGRVYKCSSPGCKYRERISSNTQTRCPNCHKKLTIVGSNEKRLFVCTCGYREKVENFYQKHANKDNVNKKEVYNYLKNQEKDIPKNNPFLDAFNSKK